MCRHGNFKGACPNVGPRGRVRYGGSEKKGGPWGEKVLGGGDVIKTTQKKKNTLQGKCFARKAGQREGT